MKNSINWYYLFCFVDLTSQNAVRLQTAVPRTYVNEHSTKNDGYLSSKHVGLN